MYKLKFRYFVDNNIVLLDRCIGAIFEIVIERVDDSVLKWNDQQWGNWDIKVYRIANNITQYKYKLPTFI